MAKRERVWTPAQRNAIEARGGTLIVPAAAGSGKTSVLSERVIRLISDPKNPVEISRLLVVTFTRAAAAEMKERIAKNLSELLRQDPGNEWLQKQQILLPTAQICTIDSFCSQLVREHFQKLNVSPDFRFAEDNDMKLLRMEVAEEVIEGQYQRSQRGSAFGRMTDLVTGSRNDTELRDSIITMYDFIQSHPFPDAWLTKKLNMLAFDGNPADSPWGEVLLGHVNEVTAYCLALCDKALGMLKEDGAFWEKRAPNFLEDRDSLHRIRQAASERDWEKLYEAVRCYSASRLGTPFKRSDEPLAVRTKSMREEVKSRLTALQKLISAGEADFRDDTREHYQLSEALFHAVRLFAKRYTERKREKGVLDFSDLIHLVIRLLVESEDETLRRTPLAEELAAAYDEIMIDEYQDTNEAQDLMFRALSRNETNLFLVGDVKQSIYGFRQATPTLFLARCERYPAYDPSAECYPAKIALDRNFRSREGVTGVINFLFRQLMTKESGGLQYAGEEELVPAAQYAERDEETAELHIIERGDAEGSRREVEARYIAALIQNMVDRKMTVQDQGVERPLRYGDVCILLRKGRGAAEKYVRELEQRGIPAWAEESGGFFETPEISTIVSLLKVIDNPNQDIPLLAVMLSPIYGFTNAEMARMRADHPGGSLYYAVRAAAETSEKTSRFLETLSRFRTLSATLPVDTLMDRLYEQTGYTAVVQAMKNGGLRLKNLRLIQEYARSYAENGRQGLSAFIRFIDRMAENGLNFSQASSASETGNVVRIITIHKAKGLEFPVCILADSVYKHKGKNNGPLLLHAGLGLGAKRQELEGLVRYATLPYEAVRLSLEKESAAEEMRILYVALTRAREKIIVTAVMDNPERELMALAGKITEGPVLNPFSVREMGSMAQWILSGALRHPSGEVLRQRAEAGQEIVLPCLSDWKIMIAPPPEETAERETVPMDSEPSEALLADISEILSYTYPGRERARIPSKISVTDLVKEQERARWKYKTRPHFLSQAGLTPAERGTAMHKYMQYAVYEQAAADPEAERQRLVEQKFLSPEEGESIKIEGIRLFFQSDLGRRILSARHYPEVRFQTRVPARAVLPDLEPPYDSQPVVLNGVVDCVLEEEDGLVVIDYKTDHVAETEELLAHYKRQLEVYAQAMEECMGKRVKERILYSFHLGKSIPV